MSVKTPASWNEHALSTRPGMPYIYIYIYIYVQTWSELLAPLVNMIKEGCENESALLILLIFYFKK